MLFEIANPKSNKAMRAADIAQHGTMLQALVGALIILGLIFLPGLVVMFILDRTFAAQYWWLVPGILFGSIAISGIFLQVPRQVRIARKKGALIEVPSRITDTLFSLMDVSKLSTYEVQRLLGPAFDDVKQLSWLIEQAEAYNASDEQWQEVQARVEALLSPIVTAEKERKHQIDVEHEELETRLALEAEQENQVNQAGFQKMLDTF